MRNSKLFPLTVLVFILVTGCGQAEKVTVSPAAPVEKPAAIPPAAVSDGPVGRITGTVIFEGPVPAPVRSPVKSFSECAAQHPEEVFTEDVLVKDGKLQNVFVYVKSGLDEAKPLPPAEGSAMVDQAGCMYKPHVLGLRTNQELIIKNSDVTLHNVHSHSANQKDFNAGMPVQGMKIKKSFTAPEVMVKLTCDVHPWMKAYIGVLSHPWFAVSGEDGNFEIKDLPPGTYTLEAWHETFGTRTQEITVGPSETKEISFSFSAT